MLACKSYILSSTLEEDDEDIWSKIQNEILQRDEQFSADLNMRNFQAQIESRLKVGSEYMFTKILKEK